MSERRATRDSWQISPFPAARARVRFVNRYTAAEYERLKQGLIPASMDDRWFAYLEDDWLALHRSWTGYCFYRVRFAPDGNGVRADDAADTDDIERLIEHYLLNWAYLPPE